MRITSTQWTLAAAIALIAGLVLAGVGQTANGEDKQAQKEYPGVLKFKVKTIEDKDVVLGDKYDGKVLLIVNVASKCGYTKQYKDLQQLHKKYGEKGLAILGFPCNQFGGQEPGSNEQIAEFCEETYGVEFAMFSKIDVNGDDQAPLYKYLTHKKTNTKAPEDEKIKWNFEKFLVAHDGTVLAHWRSKAKPTGEEMIDAVEAALKARAAAQEAKQ